MLLALTGGGGGPNTLVRPGGKEGLPDDLCESVDIPLIPSSTPFSSVDRECNLPGGGGGGCDLPCGGGGGCDLPDGGGGGCDLPGGGGG